MATAWHHTDCNDLFLSSRKKLLQTLCSDLVINLCLPVTRYTDSSYGISSWCLWSYSVFPSQSTALWLVDKMKWNLQGSAGSSSTRTCSRLMGLNRGGVWCWSLCLTCVFCCWCACFHMTTEIKIINILALKCIVLNKWETITAVGILSNTLVSSMQKRKNHTSI